MVTKIKLDQYVLNGGLVENLNLEQTFTRYTDSNIGLSISNITFSHMSTPSSKLTKPEPIYSVMYSNGKTHKYHGMWIETSVKMILDSSYTTNKQNIVIR